MKSIKSKVNWWSFKSPLCSLFISKISLTKETRYSKDFWALSLSCPCIIISSEYWLAILTIPIRPFKGVRISWLIVFKNWVFISTSFLACSASKYKFSSVLFVSLMILIKHKTWVNLPLASFLFATKRIRCQLPSFILYSVVTNSSSFSLSSKVLTSIKGLTNSRYSGATKLSQTKLNCSEALATSFFKWCDISSLAISSITSFIISTR